MGPGNREITVHMGTLKIPKLMKHHQGFYQCLAHNTHGEDLKTIYLTVVGKLLLTFANLVSHLTYMSIYYFTLILASLNYSFFFLFFYKHSQASREYLNLRNGV